MWINRLSAPTGLHCMMAILSVAGTGLCVAGASPPEIQSLGVLAGYDQSNGYSVSGDGSVVVGYCSRSDGVTRAFRWTPTTGMVDIGTLGGASAIAFAVSDDGAVIVGEAAPSGSSSTLAFRYTASGMVSLGVLADGSGSVAYDTNSNGSVVVGWSYTFHFGPWQAFKWTLGGGLIPFNAANAYANATNSDGSVVVGQKLTGEGHLKAVRWTDDEELELGTLGGTNSRAYGLSDDGTVVVGFSGTTIAPTNVATHAYRWTSLGGMEDLGTLGGMNSYAYRVSRDGNLVFGSSVLAPPGSESHAFIWSRKTGMIDLHEYLESLGAALGDWQLSSVSGISADGTALVGTGQMGGAMRAWIVTGLSLGVQPCLGDYNGEADAGDILDFLDFFEDFGACEGQTAPCGTLGNPDVNGDTIIDILDFLDFLDAFGQGC